MGPHGFVYSLDSILISLVGFWNEFSFLYKIEVLSFAREIVDLFLLVGKQGPMGAIMLQLFSLGAVKNHHF